MSEPKSLRKEARAKILMILLFSEEVFGLAEETTYLNSLQKIFKSNCSFLLYTGELTISIIKIYELRGFFPED